MVKTNARLTRKQRIWRDMKSSRWLYLMLLPVVVNMLIFSYGPMYGIQIAFRNFRLADGIWGSTWVGLDQFRRVFNSLEFPMVLWNSIRLNIFLLIFSFPIPIVLALLLNEIRNKYFKRVAQTVMYLPFFIAWVIIAGIIIQMLSPSTGVINSIIRLFGGDPIHFMANHNWWQVVFVTSDIWKSAGFGTILYLAAISSIDVEQYEAARIDGASRFQQCMKITLPCLIPTISLLLIFNIAGMMNVGFDQVFNLSNSMVRPVSEVFSVFVFRMGIERMQYSFTMAVGLFQTLVNLMLMLTANYISGKMGGSKVL